MSTTPPLPSICCAWKDSETFSILQKLKTLWKKKKLMWVRKPRAFLGTGEDWRGI